MIPAYKLIDTLGGDDRVASMKMAKIAKFRQSRSARRHIGGRLLNFRMQDYSICSIDVLARVSANFFGRSS